VCGSLEGAGLDIDPDMQRKMFCGYLLQFLTEKRVTMTQTLGWNAVCDEHAFVLPNGRVISATALSERVVLMFARGKHEERGALDQWMDGAAKLAGGHTLGVLSMSIAFAGPLLWLGRFESGGFHYYGGSSIGKTTHQRLACSVWGSGDPDRKPVLDRLGFRKSSAQNP
jgi:uncharacterized protein (DUF927 family)